MNDSELLDTVVPSVLLHRLEEWVLLTQQAAYLYSHPLFMDEKDAAKVQLLIAQFRFDSSEIKDRIIGNRSNTEPVTLSSVRAMIEAMTMHLVREIKAAGGLPDVTIEEE